MNATFSPRVAVAALLIISVLFGCNHIAARIAFDHGASVATGVLARSAGTALVLFAVMRFAGVSMKLPRTTFLRGLVIGLLVALQSYCLYSSVALIPAALALIAFNIYPMILALAQWALDGSRPSNRALVAMPTALAGLVLALDLLGKYEVIADRWQTIGAGVLYGFGAAVACALTLLLTGRWLQDVDGRMRTFLAMTVTAVSVILFALPVQGFALPADTAGWSGLAFLTLFYGLAITSFFIVQPMPGVARYTAAMNFEPIALLFMGWVILGQSMKPLQIAGAFVVIGAVILLGSKK